VTDSTSDPHVRFSLGLYLLGSLPQQERESVERHLASCADCRTESDQLGEVVAALALLSEEEGREVVEEFGVPPKPVITRTIPAPKRTRRSRALLSIAGLVVVVLISVGVIIGLSVSGGGTTTTPVTITLAATAADTSSGATVSVVATGHDGRVTVRATVTGLHAGTKYQLYAVTSDGALHVVTSWVGVDAPQDVSGDLPLSPRQLSFFTVTLADSTPVVSAYLK
jgi:anti-sigma factor RsiW